MATQKPAKGSTYLYAVVSIQVPAHPTPEQKVLWKQLAEKSMFNPRQSA